MGYANIAQAQLLSKILGLDVINYKLLNNICFTIIHKNILSLHIIVNIWNILLILLLM